MSRPNILPYFIKTPGKIHCRCSLCGDVVREDPLFREKHKKECSYAWPKEDYKDLIISGKEIVYQLRDLGGILSISFHTPLVEVGNLEDGRYHFETLWLPVSEAHLYKNSRGFKVIHGKEEIFMKNLNNADLGLLAPLHVQDNLEIVAEALPGIIDIYSLKMLVDMHRTKGHFYKPLLTDEEASSFFTDMNSIYKQFLENHGYQTDENMVATELFEVKGELILRVIFKNNGNLTGFLVSENYIFTTEHLNLRVLLKPDSFESRSMILDKNVQDLMTFGQRYPSFGIIPFWENAKDHFDYFYPLLCPNYHKGMEMLVKCGCSIAAQFGQNYYLEKSFKECNNTLSLYGLSAKNLRKVHINVFKYETPNYARLVPLAKSFPGLFSFSVITPAMMSLYMAISRQHPDATSKNHLNYMQGVQEGYGVSYQQVLKILRYMSEHPSLNYRLYEDYIRMCFQLDIKPDLAPENLDTVHNQLVREINRRGHYLAGIEQRADFLNHVDSYAHLETEPVTFSEDPDALFAEYDYFIKVPSNPENLIKEGQLMHHCVGTYIREVARGRSKILFLRMKSDPDKPLVTIELQGNTLVQAKAACNQKPTRDVQCFIRKWCSYHDIIVQSSDLRLTA